MHSKSYKIAVIGNQDVILPFQVIGFDLFPVMDPKDAKPILKQLADEDYGIVYITEDIAKDIPETINFYDGQVTPAVILIPTHKENLGIGLQRIQDNVEKAVGANIL